MGLYLSPKIAKFLSPSVVLCGRCYCCWWQWCLFLSSYYFTSECIEHIESTILVSRWSSFSCYCCCCHHHHHFQQKPPWLHQITHANLDTTQYVYITKSWHDRIITFRCIAHVEAISSLNYIHCILIENFKGFSIKQYPHLCNFQMKLVKL